LSEPTRRPAGYEELGFRECGEVDLLQNGKRNLARSRGRICGSTGLSMNYSLRYYMWERRKIGDKLDNCVDRVIEREEENLDNCVSSDLPLTD
jgi:hypothetical protein